MDDDGKEAEMTRNGRRDERGTARMILIQGASRQALYTGGKGWCPGLVHYKSITRTWTKYQAKTHLVHPKSIQNFPSQFPCSVPGSGNGWYIHSVPDHVTRMFPSGTPWEHLEFSQRKYPEFTRVAHSEFPLQCSHQCDHSVPSQ